MSGAPERSIGAIASGEAFMSSAQGEAIGLAWPRYYTVVLLTLIAIALGGFVAHRLARAADVEVEPTLTYMLFIGLVAARLAFVLRWRDQYFDVPLSILNIRDGARNDAEAALAELLFAPAFELGVDLVEEADIAVFLDAVD